MASSTTQGQTQRFGMNAVEWTSPFQLFSTQSADYTQSGVWDALLRHVSSADENESYNALTPFLVSLMTEQQVAQPHLSWGGVNPSWAADTLKTLGLRVTVSVYQSLGTGAEWAPPLGDPYVRQAQAGMAGFRAFYSALADQYERALAGSGKVADRKLAFARGEGAERLASLEARLQARNAQQVTQVERVLTGLRQISGSTTGLAGRGSLLVKLVGDLERRLDRFHLVASTTHIIPDTRVIAPTESDSPAFAA